MPRNVELSLQIVSPARMQKLNLAYRGKNKPTDVLSFPLLTQNELRSTRGKKHGILHLGDIFVNREDAKKNFLFLAVHGFLHLLGFDHERSPREAKVMSKLQDEILHSLRN